MRMTCNLVENHLVPNNHQPEYSTTASSRRNRLSHQRRPPGSVIPELELTSTDLHVWFFILPEVTMNVEWLTRCHSSLSAAERRRFGGLRPPQQRIRAILSRYLLRSVIANYIQEEPARVPVRQACRSCGGNHGPIAPLDAGPHRAEAGRLHVSSSRSGRTVAFAFATCGVGVDVELVREFEWQNIVDEFWSETERQRIYALPPTDRTNWFFTMWTRSEAAGKLAGQGIVEGLHGSTTLSSDERDPHIIDLAPTAHIRASVASAESRSITTVLSASEVTYSIIATSCGVARRDEAQRSTSSFRGSEE